MKKMMIKSLKSALAALVVGGLVSSASAADDGSIYSIDLMSGSAYGGIKPTEASPLTIGEKAVIRVRLANSNAQDPTHVTDVKSWYLSPTAAYSTTSDTIAALYPLQLGIMLGSQQVYADFVAAVPLTTAAVGTFTDLYFSYTVKPGDLAMPAQLMNSAGQATGEGSAATYMLKNTQYWQITNEDGGQPVFCFMSDAMSNALASPGEDPNRSVSGIGMGLYVKTVDFDANYAGETASDESVWRKFHQGLTTTTTIQPTIVVNGTPEAAVTMYVWVEDETVAQPLAADNPTFVTDDATTGAGRHVLKVSFAKGDDPTKSFRLKGLANGKTKVCLSSSQDLVVNDLGDRVTNWVERVIEVVDPPAPYASVEVLDRSALNAIAEVTASTNYQDYVAILKLSLNVAAPTDDVTMTLDLSEDICPADESGRRIGISEKTDSTSLPWLDRTLSVTFAAGDSAPKYLYVYALDQTVDLAGKVTITPVLSDAGTGAAAAYTGAATTGSLSVKPATPVIFSPATGDVLSDAIAGEAYTLDLVLGDSYRRIRQGGWKVQLKSGAFGDSKWHDFPAADGSTDDIVIDAESGEASLNVIFTQAKDDADLEIRVVDPKDEKPAVKTSASVKVKLSVSAPKTASAEFDRGTGQYAESRTETAKAFFTISQPADNAKALYAFLRPLNDDATNKVTSTAFTTSVPSTGVYIAPGELTSGARYAELTLLDGSCSAMYEVVICSTSEYNSKREASYVSGQCVLSVTNVVPTISSVSMGGTSVKVSGGVMTKKVAQNITKAFSVNVTDPGQLDLEAAGDDAFCVKWNFGGEEVVSRGNPNTNTVSHTFTSPGDVEVTVQCQDKDMRANGLWTDEFSFTVQVLDAPKIEITQKEGLTSFSENDTGDSKSHFDVKLNVAPDFKDPADRLYVDLTVECLDDSASYTPADCVLSKTTLSFASGTTEGQSFNLKSLDGTADSAGSGFRIVATARTEPDGSVKGESEGKTWIAGEYEINVQNAAPTISMPTALVDAEGKAIQTQTTLNESLSLGWSVTDVPADRAGLTVTWVTSEGSRMEYVQGTGDDTDARKYVADIRSGRHTFSFSSSGEKTVTMTVTDKDGSQSSVTLYYTIAASKSMEIVPTGPSSGNGTTRSAKYFDRASGLGEGRVWTKNAPSQVSGWVFTYACGLENEFRVYGRGYRVGDVDPFADASGNAVSSSGLAGYAYSDPVYDSFLYCWLQVTRDSGKTSGSSSSGSSTSQSSTSTLTDTLLSVSPEHPEQANSGTPVGLPTAKDEGADSYSKTMLEAIFSREMYATDNMGDINLDGIPDAYVKNYCMDVFDSDGAMIEGADDLKSLKSYNEDDDAIPSGTALLKPLQQRVDANALTNVAPFTALLEIRGYGTGLNDAPTLAGLKGFRPDRRYTDPAKDADSTLSAVEYLAWLDYAAANGLDATASANWEKWSPERPTDPTTDDTDKDGFSDGFEYYYWYHAHVGCLETSMVGGVTVTNHVYLTGRRLDPTNPEGTVIPSETIAEMMDPLTAWGDAADAETRDTDNDGLPDYLEFELGTNPFDFDTDRDGLPDGYEVAISQTDPLMYATDGTTCDAARNLDGDHMAYTTVYRALVSTDACGEVRACGIDGRDTKNIVYLSSFAVVDPDGDPASAKWYVVADADGVKVETATRDVAVTTFDVYDGTGKWADTNSWTRVAVVGSAPFVDVGAIGKIDDVKRLAADVEADQAFLVETDKDGAVVRGLPKRLVRGTYVSNVAAADGYVERVLPEGVAGEGAKCNAAWQYGTAEVGYGELAIGPTASVASNAVLVAALSDERKVAYVHSYVYQQFGYDPRTAWSSSKPFTMRGAGEVSSFGETNVMLYSTPMRTRPYTAYDEYLLLSYYLNSDALDVSEVTPTQSKPWSTIYATYLTNPRGKEEIENAKSGASASASGSYGDDTDGDGVPDGWELYVMSGDKDEKGNFVIKGPDTAFSPTQPFSKFTADEQDPDTDGLNEAQEFASWATCLAYSNVTATISKDTLGTWVNKILPTNPYSADTDGDGISDSAERDAFSYGDPLANQDLETALCIPGGGLNPCSVDTDRDGLPDGWELQFAGSYIGDSTTADDSTAATAAATTITNGMDGTFADAELDYDRDGLENWQEYMVGAMRCWRYDDPYSRWTPIPDEWYFDPDTLEFNPDLEKLGCTSLDDFWYKTLVDKKSGLYNPHLITGRDSAALYFSHVTNAWDVVFKVGNQAVCMFKDRVDDMPYSKLFGEPFTAATDLKAGEPKRYISCSPIKADTDQDGMDDGYELFHGLNPLLGAAGVIESSTDGSLQGGPCDIVYAAYCGDSPGNSFLTAYCNLWLQTSEIVNQMYPPTSDFVNYPWLNGMAQADPDGDDIRNQDEAILARVGGAAGYHTDPSPLWMTDTYYTNSLTSRFYLRPARDEQLVTDAASFTVGSNAYWFVDFPGFSSTQAGILTGEYAAILPDYGMQYMFSFEQSEGYDTDVDYYGDKDEIDGKFVRASSDPQLAESPTRRQAMYFQGPAKKSMVMQMPYKSVTRADGTSIVNELAFTQFTVECWACPETLDDATILERTVNVRWSHPADENCFRRNFNISIKDGKWYAYYESNGTLAGDPVATYSRIAAETNVWTHLAATYDGTALRLYVNGQELGVRNSGLRPCNGSSFIAVNNGKNAKSEELNRYASDDGDEGIFVLGASAEASVTSGAGIESGSYSNFYTGYIDEVRVWDGARSASEIRGAMNTRYTAEMALDNRETVYEEWSAGKRRYLKDDNGNDYDATPELRYHYSFDSLASGENENDVAKTPHGFGETGVKPPAGRPEGYEAEFWTWIVYGHASDVLPYYPYGSVYNDRGWIPWIPNTVAQLPRLDGLTMDSQYWTSDFMGDVPGAYKFPRTAEPYIGWVQAYKLDSSAMPLNMEFRQKFFKTLTSSNFENLYDFENRHRNVYADALLPLGGAYAKYVPASLGLWDDQGASTTSPLTGRDSDNDGLPDWWELYAEENYRRADMDPAEFIGWETVVDYNGRSMTAGEAYLYDLAHGAYLDADGNAHVAPDDATKAEYAQTADVNGVGLPDWWTEMYGLTGESALDDHDHDGLSNYHEYLLSEVFSFQGLTFDPTVACSVDPNTPDYFYRVGSLYVGEIFTDHDLVDDDWEDKYDTTFASRLAYDAFADTDEDGWSNRSENRYAKQCQPITANYAAHYSDVDGLVRDHPTPTLNVKLRYNGAHRTDAAENAIETAPIYVYVRSEAHANRVSTWTDPDAVFKVSGGSAENTTNADSDDSANEEVSYTRTLGKWSARHAVGTLTPGSLKQNSISLQFCADPSVQTYRWYYVWNDTYAIRSGTAKELRAARNKYGSDNIVVLSKTSDYKELTNYDTAFDDETQTLTWSVPDNNNKTLATINLVTGAYDIDFNAMKGQYASSTNGDETVSLEDQTYRIVYEANPSVGLPRNLYLGQATSGYVREGKNTVMAFVDVDGDGKYTAGEPMGVVRGVNVSWRASDLAEIELLETTPLTARYDLVSGDTDREAKFIANSSDVYSTGTNTVSTDADQRVRVVRYAVDNVTAGGGALDGADAAIVYDGVLRASSKDSGSPTAGAVWLTEDDILSSAVNEFDLDWDATRYTSGVLTLSDLYKKYFASASSLYRMTNVYYAVVLGNGAISTGNPAATNFMGKMIVRSFDLNRRRPTLIAPTGIVGGTGSANDSVVYDAAPTFQWTMNGNNTYTAFRLQVLKDSTVVYDSGYQRMPALDDLGRCSWTAPVFAGDKTTKGVVVDNGRLYTWKLSVYNAKFRDDDFVTSRPYYLNVQTNSAAYGNQRVAVRYFGPKESYKGKTIHVQAFKSPDFTGQPVASGYVAAPDDADCGVSVTGKVVQANMTLIGIPKGTCYLRAYIDSNNNGVCDSWETMGYLCTRDGSSSDILDPVALSFANANGKGDVVQIFMEDADTDQDGLPDAWEYATYGSLTAKGVELLSATPAGQKLVNKSLSGALTLQSTAYVPSSGLTGQAQTAVQSAGTVALALGLSQATTGSFADNISAAIEPELEEDGVSVSSIAIDADGNISLTVEVEAEASTTAASAFTSVVAVPKTIDVTCTVYHTASLAEEWKALPSQTLTISVGTQTETLSLPTKADATSGFYKVEITK